MEIFIRGLGNISPQLTYEHDRFLDEIKDYTGIDYLSCIEPGYKTFLDPIAARRMSHVIKMGVAASKICLADAGVEMPGAIITATGLGCLVDSEKFLASIIENKEQLLTPTPFIQSTHNTIGGQIALLLKCHEYNTTYVNRGFSFENGLQDSMLLLREGTATNVLLGAIDEVTHDSYTITKRLGHWKNGAKAGEGAAFFLLNNEPSEKNYARITALKTIYKPSNAEIEKGLEDFLETTIRVEDIDLVILGASGDKPTDVIYQEVAQKYFKDKQLAYFKHLCGDYHTASSFALWLAANIIKTQDVPVAVKLDKGTNAGNTVKNVLIFNHYQHINYSMYLVSQC